MLQTLGFQSPVHVTGRIRQPDRSRDWTGSRSCLGFGKIRQPATAVMTGRDHGRDRYPGKTLKGPKVGVDKLF